MIIKKRVITISIMFGILLLGIFTRLFLLDKIPMGLRDDEIDFVLTAKSVFLNGKTLDGIFSPFSFKPVPTDVSAPSARTPYMLQSPIVGILPLGLFTSKVGYATISILLIVIWFFIAYRFWGTKVAFFTAGLLALNPWAIHMGRTAFDAPVSIFLAYLSFSLFLFLKNWWILIALVPWIAGLQAYHGINIVYLLYLAIICLSSWRLRKKTYGKQYGIAFGIGIICFLWFLLSMSSDRVGSRFHELLLPNNPELISSVNTERRSAIQTSVNEIFSNRYIIFAREFFGKYISSFSTAHLFAYGESLSVYSLRILGFFYPIDIFLILIGLFTALIKSKKKSAVFLALLAISPIPTAFSYVETSFGQRSALMYPILCMFAGIGVASIFESKTVRYFWKVLLAAIYTSSFVYFLYVYFIFNPVNNSEAFGLSYRILANYINRIPKSDRIVFVSNGSVNTFKQYLFYSNTLQKNTISEIQSKIRSKQYILDNVEFINCPEKSVNIPVNWILIVPYGAECQTLSYRKHSSMLAIAYLKDSGRIYEIYNDSLCSQYSLSSYQNLLTFQDLSIESLDNKRFCETYISKPNIILETNETED